MKRYDFDQVIDRNGSCCIKYDQQQQFFGREDLMPMWIADMDFATPDFILDALRKRLEHPILGYSYAPESYTQSIHTWLKYKYNWDVEADWLRYVPGIVKGIAFALHRFTSEQEKVVIQPPVYHPFRLVPEGMKRHVVENPLQLVDGTYKMNFEHLEELFQNNDCRALILCNPHNPAGIVWEKEVLIRLAKLCKQYGVLVISDEIHAELAFPQFRHHPFPTVCEEAAENSITFMSPSKTFNIAGLVSSYSIIPNAELREHFYSYMESGEFCCGTFMAFTATEAAYTYGAEWLQQMRCYVMDNITFATRFLETYVPSISVYQPQASFLLWLDCTKLGLNDEELASFFKNDAKLALNAGVMFGTGGSGHMRMNIGCPRSVLEEALKRLQVAVEKLGK